MAVPILNQLQPFSRYNHPNALPVEKKCESYQQTSAETKRTDITILTDEGDAVVLSAVGARAHTLSTENISSPGMSKESFVVSRLVFDKFQVSVQGDLNEEELADIKSLMDDLTTIADDFFHGRMDKAIQGAMKIDDMGSLSQLSATFSHTAVVSSRLTEFHSMPSADSDALSRFDDLKKAAEDADAIQYASLLKAQWEQIKEFLDRTSESAPGPQESNPVTRRHGPPATEHMMDRINKIVAKHPRISPFILPLVNRAIDESMLNSENPGAPRMKHALWTDFLKSYDNWLIPVRNV
ncbi:MAG: hypothetical protein U9O82_00580 [Thermodesulfobacteriota bacterium]|nr:hypothetical protein [Thermodesulfobacteriota bacterium]